MNFLNRLLLLMSAIVAVSIVNEVLSSEQHSADRWLRSNEEPHVEVKHCLSPYLIDEDRHSCRLYTVVIDAGSTGTRMHLFEFSYDLNRNTAPFRVEKETFKEVKPGLSAFAPKPEEARNSVNELIVAAQAAVPRAYWQYTPITLKATAGLRLLPNEQANRILNYVEERVANSGFVLDTNGVDIMSGTDEGIFSWYTLNVLTDRMKNIVSRKQADVKKQKAAIKSGDHHTSATALDLGGGSTQITFIPSNRNKVFHNVDESKFSQQLNVFGNPVDLYTHSYLGNGLVAARIGITKGTTKSKFQHKLLRSNCLPADFNINLWDYAGQQWNVTGTSESSFAECLQSAINYVDQTGVQEVQELNDHDIYVFSYFYDRGIQAGLIPHAADNRGGRTSVHAYKKAAMRACSLPSQQLGPEHWKPWQCLDLSYIYALLRYGYGLNDNKELFLAKRLRNMEMSWALGAAHDLLHRYLKKTIAFGVEISSNITTVKSLQQQKKMSSFTVMNEIFGFISEQTLSIFSFLNLIS